MKSLTLAKILPCAVFFADRRPVLGLTALVMQASLLFWPVATRWAQENHARAGIERMLAELSENYRAPVAAADPYREAPKKFRQLA